MTSVKSNPAQPLLSPQIKVMMAKGINETEKLSSKDILHLSFFMRQYASVTTLPLELTPQEVGYLGGLIRCLVMDVNDHLLSSKENVQKFNDPFDEDDIILGEHYLLK